MTLENLPPTLLADTTNPSWQHRVLEALGYDFSRVPEGAQTQFLWTNLPQSWEVFVLIAVAAALAYGVFWLYRREIDICPLPVKYVLATLRGLALLVLGVIFLGPAYVIVQHRPIQPEIVLGRDASLSMATKDRYSDETAAKIAAEVLGQSIEEVRAARPTRASLVNQMLSDGNRNLLADMQAKGRIKAINFADRVEKVESRSAAKGNKTPEPDPDSPKSASSARETQLPPLVAQGRGTDLSQAIRQGLAGEKPAAIILASDGEHTGKDDPREAAREAAAQGVPVFTIGFGDPSRPRNLRVANVYVRPQVWVEEPFEVDAMILAQGMEARDVRVELIEQRMNDSDGSTSAGVAVASQQLAVPDGGGRLRVEFSHTAKEPGKFAYAVKVEPVDDELAEDDNQAASAAVRVLSREKIRVLLVSGAPSWDYRLVHKLLARDKTITVSCWLQTLDEERAQDGTRQITHLPATKDELFWYDVVLMFDPNPQEFDKAWLELLKEFCGSQHAGGLLYMAGPKHSSAFLGSARTSALRDLLPVRFGDVGELELKNLLTTSQRAWPLRVVSANVDHPVMSFYPDRQETLRRWETLPGIFWSFPSLEPKPTAVPLVEHADPSLRSVEASRPLLVAGRYGAGHTMYIGFNGTFRWRRAGRQAEFFDKFWIQTVRYLVEGRSLAGMRRGYAQTDRDRYEIGEKVTITARLQNISYEPLVEPRVETTLHVEGDQPETVFLLPVPNRPGVYEAAFTAKKTGNHTLRIRLPGTDSEGGNIETPFTVELPSVETNQVWLDKALLTDIAKLSGGQYFEANQMDDLIAAIPDKTQIVEVREKPQPLWDKQGLLGALVGLLGLEWLLRKRFKLL